jgi:hypothetical protein
MSKRISRISPWQAGKLFAVIYFGFSLLIVILIILVSAVTPLPPQAKARMGTGFLLVLPFLYALAGLIFIPLGCWVYNVAAGLVGGLEITLTEEANP